MAAIAVLAVAGLTFPGAISAEAISIEPGDILFDSNRTGNLELHVLHRGAVRQLTGDRRFDSFWPKVAPDGSAIVFHRTPRGVRDRDYTTASTWIMGVDGRGIRPLLAVGAHGWDVQAHVEWSPDGSTLAMIGGRGDQVFLVDRNGGNPRRVTRDAFGGPRPGTNIDPSWAPDGRSLLFVGCPVAVCTDRLYEVYRVNPDGTGEVRLTNDLVPDYDPYWAPDGSAIAWLRNTGTITRWGILVMQPDGSQPRTVIDDGGTNSKPEWGSDSSTIYFHRAPGTTGGSPLFNIYWAARSGGGFSRLLPDHGGAFDNEYPELVGPRVPPPPSAPVAPKPQAVLPPTSTKASATVSTPVPPVQPTTNGTESAGTTPPATSPPLATPVSGEAVFGPLHEDRPRPTRWAAVAGLLLVMAGGSCFRSWRHLRC